MSASVIVAEEHVSAKNDSHTTKTPPLRMRILTIKNPEMRAVSTLGEKLLKKGFEVRTDWKTSKPHVIILLFCWGLPTEGDIALITQSDLVESHEVEEIT